MFLMKSRISPSLLSFSSKVSRSATLALLMRTRVSKEIVPALLTFRRCDQDLSRFDFFVSVRVLWLFGSTTLHSLSKSTNSCSAPTCLLTKCGLPLPVCLRVSSLLNRKKLQKDCSMSLHHSLQALFVSPSSRILINISLASITWDLTSA